jgi:gluconate transporter
MPLLIVAQAVALLLLIIVRFKVNPLPALLLVALETGLLLGMPAGEVAESMTRGVGGTLGELALVLALGAMLGEVIVAGGAAQRITQAMTSRFRGERLPWGMMLTGLIIGIPLFYNVGFILMIPLIFSVARQTGRPSLYIGLPACAALSVTHGFLPPHPAPVLITGEYGADIGQVLLYGLLLALPTIAIAGPLLARVYRNWTEQAELNMFTTAKPLPQEQLPGLGISLLAALAPVLLIASAELLQIVAWPASVLAILEMISQPVIALLLAWVLGFALLAFRGLTSFEAMMERMTPAVKSIAMILLIIAGGGAFKQVLVDSGTDRYIVGIMSQAELSPLFMAWLIAAVLRIALGSATLAAITAAGIAAPLAGAGANPELLVLATGAGSLTFSQVNDTGFWMFKEFFGLSIKQTFQSWTLMETIVSICGLVGCLVLDWFI